MDMDPEATSPHDIALADLLVELIGSGSAVSRTALRDRWLNEFPEDAATQRMNLNTVQRRAQRQNANRDAADRGRRGDGKLATGGTVAKKRILRGLTRLERLGAVRRDNDTVIVTDRALLEEIARL